MLTARSDIAKGIKNFITNDRGAAARLQEIAAQKSIEFPDIQQLTPRFRQEENTWWVDLYPDSEDARTFSPQRRIESLSLTPVMTRRGVQAAQMNIPGGTKFGGVRQTGNWNAAFPGSIADNLDFSDVSLKDAFIWGIESERDKAMNADDNIHFLSPHESYDLSEWGGLRGHFLGPLANIPNVGKILASDPGRKPMLEPGGFRGVGQPDILNALPTQAHQVAAIGGNALGHVLTTWPFRAAWNSHPGDLMGSVGGPAIGKQFGFQHKLPGEVYWTVTPAAVGVAGIVSGNVDLSNLLNTEEGPRPAGYQANYANPDDRTKTDNYLLSLLSVPIGGGYVRLLPWEQFSAERPGVTEQQYREYSLMKQNRADETERDDDFSTSIGPIAISGTMKNLEGVPEVNVGGGRITLPGAVAGLGTMGGLLYLMRPRNAVS
ncbi:MAG: hypothetical protein ACO3YZ_04735 [Candidatus Nanopelagicaceae bacterium]